MSMPLSPKDAFLLVDQKVSNLNTLEEVHRWSKSFRWPILSPSSLSSLLCQSRISSCRIADQRNSIACNTFDNKTSCGDVIMSMVTILFLLSTIRRLICMVVPYTSPLVVCSPYAPQIYRIQIQINRCRPGNVG